jgi:hypothetical protein
VNVFDPGEQKHLCVVNPAWQFRVVEDVSYGGVANLHLQAMQVEPAQPLVVA